MGKLDKVKVVISDCHLSAGRFFEGRLNPHEDFHFDEEMTNMFRYFSTGEYGTDSDGNPIPVELVINGDFFDFLNVPFQGEFEDMITEEIAVYKIRAILKGHPGVMKALKDFASLPGKKITYLIGNHDADLFFPKVREEIIRAWDPEGRVPSKTVEIVHDRDRLTYPEGFEIRHGNQFEPGSELDFESPMLKSSRGEKVLNIPWSSIYVLKIINRMKREREHIDKVRPAKIFVLFGLILDPWFTIRFAFLSFFYFIKTRLFTGGRKRSGLKELVQIFKEETTLFQDLEKQAREVLDHSSNVQTVIFGHTHRPMNKIYPDGKQYINTGTWTQMINLDYRGLGQQLRTTFALVRISEGKAECDLRQWVGETGPHRVFNG